MKKRSIAAMAMCVFSLFGLTAHAGVDVGDGNYIVFYHHDALGSPAVVTDHNGNTLWHEHNEPYGRTRDRVMPTGKEFLAADNTGDRLGYTGHTSDLGTGLVYMKARFYDPVIGRFYSNDPVGFTVDNPMMFNRYAYANNSPYTYTDPDGKAAFLAWFATPAGLSSLTSAGKFTIGALTGIGLGIGLYDAHDSILNNESTPVDNPTTSDSSPEIPDEVVGDQSHPAAGQRGKNKKHRSGHLLPEHGGVDGDHGADDAMSDFETLTGGNYQLGSGSTEGFLVGDNKIIYRPTSDGARIEIPGKRDKPPESLHYDD